jgi:hypothetical protein
VHALTQEKLAEPADRILRPVTRRRPQRLAPVGALGRTTLGRACVLGTAPRPEGLRLWLPRKPMTMAAYICVGTGRVMSRPDGFHAGRWAGLI